MKKFFLSTALIFILVVSFAVAISAENQIDKDFHSTTGELKWAFFETAGTLEYNRTNYDAGTLVIYGTGTNYGYSKEISVLDQSGYPWYEFNDKVTKIIFDTPNLESLRDLCCLEKVSEIYLPEGVNTLAESQFMRDFALRSIKVVGRDYSEYCDGNIFDFRNITAGANAFTLTAQKVTGSITVLVGEDAPQSSATSFAGGSKAKFVFYVHGGSEGAEWAAQLRSKAGSSFVASTILVETYTYEIDRGFYSAEGDLKWAFFGEDGILPYNNTQYKKGTLVIYGTGTSFEYSKSISGSDQSGYPWYGAVGNTTYCPDLRTIVFDTPNLLSLQTFGYMRAVEEIYLPASIRTLVFAQFLGQQSLKAVKIVGVDYSEYTTKNIYDLRALTMGDYAFDGVATNVSEGITVLVCDNAPQETTKQFAKDYSGTLTVVACKGTGGEAWANDLLSQAGNGQVAKNMKIVYSNAPIIDRQFYSSEGDLKWAFFVEDGVLPYNGKEYASGTLVIYGTGTSFEYSQSITNKDQTGYPWYSATGNEANCPELKTIVFDTPNLASLQNFAYLKNVAEIYLPASITSLLYSQFQGNYGLKSVNITGVDYSEFDTQNIIDLRNLTVGDYSFNAVATNVDEDITVLVAGNAPHASVTDKTQFAKDYPGTLIIAASKGTAGETWANDLLSKAGNGCVAKNISIVQFDSNVIDQPFYSSVGDLKWAFFTSDGILPYNNNRYTEGTLVIYGTGTSYSYKGSDRADYPWYAACGSDRYYKNLKKVVFDTPNLKNIQTLAYLGALEEVYLPAGVSAFGFNTFLGEYALGTIKVTGVDYTEFGDGYVWDFRGITDVGNYTLGSAARDVTGTITVLLGKDTKQAFSLGTSQFAGNSGANFKLMVWSGGDGETWAQTLVAHTDDSGIADNITIDYYLDRLTSAIKFDGFQVRTKDYNGLRGLFSFDKTIANEYRTCVEYGAIISSVSNKDLYGTELTLVAGEYVTEFAKIRKIPIMIDGTIVGKTLGSNDQQVSFATTVVNFTDHYDSPMYMCGYEIWEDIYGNVEIVYTEVYDSKGNLYTPSLYDAVLLAFTKGAVNSSDEDENKVLWKVLENCSNSVLKHETDDVSIHLFTASRANDVAIITGSGALKDVYNLLNAAGKLSAAAGPVTIVIDHGFTSIATRTFQNNKALETLVYPEGITSITGIATFQSCDALTTVFKKGTQAVVGTIDLSYIGSVKLDNMFNGDKYNVKYIHLPTSFGDGVTEIPIAAFRKCRALMAIWCGSNAKPADGTADFTGTTITSAYTNTDNDSAFAFVPNITNFIFSE